MELDLLEGEALVGILDEQLHAEVLRRIGRVPNEPPVVHRAHLVRLVVRIPEGLRELPNVLLLRYASALFAARTLLLGGDSHDEFVEQHAVYVLSPTRAPHAHVSAFIVYPDFPACSGAM